MVQHRFRLSMILRFIFGSLALLTVAFVIRQRVQNKTKPNNLATTVPLPDVKTLSKNPAVIADSMVSLDGRYSHLVDNDKTSRIVQKPRESLSVALVFRAYAGDEVRFNGILKKSIEMFVDTTKIEVVAILDSESSEDHTFGSRLVNENITVRYSKLPFEGFPIVTPFHAKGDGRYSSTGYTRQLYDTFFLDRFTHADIIGVIDTDNTLNTFLTTSSILARTQNKILHGAVANHGVYEGDSVCMGEKVNYNFMFADTMPKFYFRQTFANLRVHIRKVLNTSNFVEAFLTFGKYPFSPVNVLAWYGLRHESNNYALVLPSDSVGMLTLGGHAQSADFSRVGCCRSFDVSCMAGDSTNIAHLLYIRNMHLNSLWPYLSYEDNFELVESHYECVRRKVESLPAWALERMREACHKYTVL